MRNVLLFIAALPIMTDGFLTYIAIRLPLKGNRAPPGAPWPHPATWEISSEILTVDVKNFRFLTNLQSCDIISEAIKRYKTLMKLDEDFNADTSLNTVTSLNIMVDSGTCERYPHLQMNESYSLVIDKTSYLQAESVWGIVRGLETFSQLIYTDDRQVVKINKTRIIDKPRFKHRGLMVDTARHFIPVSILLDNLDAMAYNKMNVFHWHIVDDQSFPYTSIRFPELSKKGAYSEKHVYSQNDIKNIIEYARLRGIRVVPEFDTPGHTQSWGKAFKELLTPCWVNGEPGKANPGLYGYGAYEILNPTKHFTFTFLEEFFTEIRSVFPDQFLHLGMDESYPRCWNSNPNVTEFMKDKNIKDTTELEQYYVRRLVQIINGLKRSYAIWQDPVEHGSEVQNDTVIQIWKDDDNTSWIKHMENISKKGYQIILSSCWYLNYISYGQDWRKYYLCEPLAFNGTQEQHDKVIGGEACIFDEYVDGTNLLSRLWPRASAVAERLWSPRAVDDVESAKFRLDQQRCRMLRRGIPAEPILNGYCGDYEAGFEKNQNRIHEKGSTTCSNNAVSGENAPILTTVLFVACLFTYFMINSK